MAPIRIVALEGDQTGQELLEQALRVLDPDVLGLEIEIAASTSRSRTGARPKRASAREAAAAMRETGLGLKAATITPEGADDVGSPNRILREAIDGKVIVRTGRRIPGVTPVGRRPPPDLGLPDGGRRRLRRRGVARGRRTATSSPTAPRRSAAPTAARSPSTRSATAERIGGRVYGGPKWTVSPVYEGMLKEEMDAAAERHPEVAYEPVLIDATLAGLVGGAAAGAARDPVPEPRRRPALRPRPAAVRLDRRRRVDPAGARRRAAHRASRWPRRRTARRPALQGKDVANPMGMILAAARAAAPRRRARRRGAEGLAGGLRGGPRGDRGRDPDPRPRRPRRDDRVHRRGDRAYARPSSG